MSAPCPLQASFRCACARVIALVTLARRGGGSFSGHFACGASKIITAVGERVPWETRPIPCRGATAPSPAPAPQKSTALEAPFPDGLLSQLSFSCRKFGRHDAAHLELLLLHASGHTPGRERTFGIKKGTARAGGWATIGVERRAISCANIPPMSTVSNTLPLLPPTLLRLLRHSTGHRHCFSRSQYPHPPPTIALNANACVRTRWRTKAAAPARCRLQFSSSA